MSYTSRLQWWLWPSSCGECPVHKTGEVSHSLPICSDHTGTASKEAGSSSGEGGSVSRAADGGTRVAMELDCDLMVQSRDSTVLPNSIAPGSGCKVSKPPHVECSMTYLYH